MSGLPEFPAARLRRIPVGAVTLVFFTFWASLISVEVLFRRPGPIVPERLPSYLQRQGVRFVRVPGSKPTKPLPAELVLLETADYVPSGRSAGGSSIVKLRLVALPSSGTGVYLPVESLGPTLIGPGVKGVCVRLNPQGVVIRKAQTAADWQALIAEDKPSAAGVALWILGLRPFRQNLCLWESEG